jgi:hypothetical protein
MTAGRGATPTIHGHAIADAVGPETRLRAAAGGNQTVKHQACRVEGKSHRAQRCVGGSVAIQDRWMGSPLFSRVGGVVSSKRDRGSGAVRIFWGFWNPCGSEFSVFS